MVFRRLEMRAGVCFALVISPLFAAAAWGQAAPADGQLQAAGSPVAAEPAKPEEKKEEAKPATPAAQPKPYEAILKDFKPAFGPRSDTAEGRQRNRRVEIVLREPDPLS